MSIRVGHGVDIHQLKDNIPLILAGINIKSNFGISGHSDGDVVIHAVVDSILGALSKGDIGTFFPSNDNRWKNENSSIFLDYTINLMEKENYKISNVDINIILEKPFLNNYILLMRKNLSSIMNIDYDFISIKATTSDKLGFIGNKEGIMATSTVLLVSSK